MHINVDFAVDFDVGVLCVAICQVVESEDDRAIGRVFKGDDAEDCAAVLDFVKHVCASFVRGLVYNLQQVIKKKTNYTFYRDDGFEVPGVIGEYLPHGLCNSCQ